jgi:hypothetical protein
MKFHRVVAQSFIAVLLTLLLVTGVSAGSVSSGGITLTFPSYPLSGPALQSCEPWNEPTANTVSLTGIPEGATVVATTIYANPYSGSPTTQPPVTYSGVSGGSLVVPVAYPTDTQSWPVFNSSTNERAISVAVIVQVQYNDGTTTTTTKLVSKQWWVRCQPPLAPFQGCTPGYWRQEHHYDSWVGYAPTDDFNTVFGVNASFSPRTLGVAVQLNGGGENALARHAVAGLLNVANPNVNYFYTEAQVLAGVQSAYATGNFEEFKDDLDFANNAGCPLN